MRKTAYIVLSCCLVLIAGSAARLRAQESAKSSDAAKVPEPPAHFYHLEFVVQETGLDGKPTNSRTYSGTVSTGRTDRGFSMRTGSRVPIYTGPPGGENKTREYQYMDVGVSIDAHDARENGDKLALSLNADISSLADTAGSANNLAPVVRQNKWQAAVLIPIGKATTVFTSDILDNRGGMQLVVTATPIK